MLCLKKINKIENRTND